MAWGPRSINTDTRTLGMFLIKVGASAPNIDIITPVLTQTDSLGAMASTKFSGAAEFHILESGYPKMEDGKIPLSVKAGLECAYKEMTSYNFALAMGKSPFNNISSTANEISSNTVLGSTIGNITVTDDNGPVTDTWIVTFTAATAGIITGVKTGHVHTFSAIDSQIAPVNPESTAGAIPYFTIPANFFSNWDADETYIFKTSQYVQGTTLYDDKHSGAVGLGSLKAPVYLRVEAVLTYPDEQRFMNIILPRAQSAAAIEFDAGDDEVNVPINFSASNADSSVVEGSAAWNENEATGVGPLGRIYWSSL